MFDNCKQRVLGKNNVSHIVIIDVEALKVNFLNVFHFFDLGYNIFSVGTPREAG